MTNKSNKKIKESKNKTKKIRNKSLPKQQTILCNEPETFHTFEDKVEELFKKNKIDIESISFNLEKQIISQLKKAVNPSGIKPNQDFYSYINERWISEYELTEKQKYIVEVDDFRIVQDKVYQELIQIIEDFINNPPSAKDMKLYKCIKNAFRAANKYNTDEQLQCLSKTILDYIDELRQNKENVWELLGMFNKNEIISTGCPFIWSINPDDKNPKIYKCYLEPPQLSLIDINVYFDDDSDSAEEKNYKKKYRAQFFKYINNMFVLCFGENHGLNPKDVFNTEFEILNAMVCDLIKEKDDDNYNLITKEEAIKNFGFDWNDFCKEIGFKKVPNNFVTSNVNYLLCGTKLLLENWNSPKWRTFWIYLYIRQQCRFNAKGQNYHYEFEGKFVRGQESSIFVTDIKSVYQMGFLFSTFLTNSYISKYNNLQAINYVKTMVEDLKTVFIRIIKRNSWMQPKTKIKALEKLYNFTLTVGSPESLRYDPLLEYKDDDAWGNLVKKALWRHERAVELVGEKVTDTIPYIDWNQTPPKFVGSQAYVVNASYTPTKNGIYIPLGYIQKPFVDLDQRGLEYNLSRIGFTIAHEMSHALDDWGSKYDEYGRLNNWWTEKDAIAFKKIQDDVIKQYETFASYDGIKFDAGPSIGEDLADISGLAICQEYLRDFQLKNEYILPIQSLSYTTFFVYFAVQSRQKLSKKSILAQLKTNPHPLDKYRCNVPISRTNVFRTIYNVKKGDKMWWHSLSNVWGN